MILAVLIAGIAGCRPVPNGEIRDWYDLHAIRYHLGENYVLMNDLDSATAGYKELASPTANQGQGWLPIGTYANKFNGTFDGQGYEICNLFIDRPKKFHAGLFGYLGCSGFIKNVRVVNADVTGKIRVGVLVGENHGTVRNSYVTGAVSGDRKIGGLVGMNGGTVRNSYAAARVDGSSYVGGLVGYRYMYGTVINSFWDIAISGQVTLDGGPCKTTA